MLVDPGNPNLYLQAGEGHNRLAVLRDGDTIEDLVVRTPDGTLYYHHPFDGTQWGGKLNYIEDRHGNRITCDYDENAAWTNPVRLASVEDTLGRTIEYHYYDETDAATGKSDEHLERVRDHLGREVVLKYAEPSVADGSLPATMVYGGQPILLESVRSPEVNTGPVPNEEPFPDGKTIRFEYESHYMQYGIPVRGGFPTQTGAEVPPVVASALEDQPWSNYWGQQGTMAEVRRAFAFPLLTEIVTPEGNSQGTAIFPFMRIYYDQASARVSQVLYGNVDDWEENWEQAFKDELCGGDPTGGGSQTAQDTQLGMMNAVNGGVVTYVAVEWPALAPCGALGDLTLSNAIDALMVTRSDSAGGTKTFQIDPAGRVKTVIERNGRIWGGTGSLGQWEWRSDFQPAGWEESCPTPCAWIQIFDYNEKGQVFRHFKANGNVEENVYDDLNHGHGRLTESRLYPGHTIDHQEYDEKNYWLLVPTGTPVILSHRKYDPIYGMVIEEVDPRDASLGGTAQYGSNPAGRFTTRHILDYQESQFGYPPIVPQLRSRFGLGDPGTVMTIGIGEQNGDGVLNRGAGDVIRTIFPTPSHPNSQEDPSAGLAVTQEYGYNVHGQLDYSVDAEGIVTRHAYEDINGGSAKGYRISTTENSQNLPALMKTVLRPAPDNFTERTTTFEYDLAGNQTKVTDPLGRETTYEYNELDQVFRETGPGPFDYTKVTSYDGNDQVSLEEWQYGESDWSGQPVPPAQVAGIVDHDGDAIDAPQGLLIAYKYDYSGMLHEQKEGYRDGNGAEVWERVSRRYYNNDQKLIREINAEGQATDYIYGARDLLSLKFVGSQLTADVDVDPPLPDHLGTGFIGFDPAASVSRYKYGYDGNKNLTCQSDAVDQTSPTSETGNTTEFDYDGYDRLHITDFPNGSSEVLDYDEASQVIRTTRFGDFVPLGTVGVPQPTPTAQGHLSRSRTIYDELSRTVRTEQDLFQPAVGVVVTDVATTEIFYDRAGATLKSIDARGNTSHVEYDQLGRTRRTASAPAIVGTDPFDVAWTTVRNHYDIADRLLEVVNTERLEDGTVDRTLMASTVYDDLDRPIQVVDALGQSARTRYDSRGKAISATDARGPLTDTFDRHSTSQTITTNAHGNRVDTVWDTLGRAARTTRTMTASG